MPVSGRPTNAALLKTTHGSSPAEVKGLHRVAREPAARGAPGAAMADSGSLRFQSRLPRMISEVVRPAKSKITAIRQRAGTASTTTLRGNGSRGGTPSDCLGDSTDLASKVK